MSNSTQLRNDRLDYFLRTVRSYFWCLVIPPILFGGMATVYALFKADTYSARQSLAVRDDLGGDSSFKLGRFDSLDSLKSAQETILEVARKSEVIWAALNKVGPDPSLFSFLNDTENYPDATTIEETQGVITIGAPNGAEFGKTEVVLLGVKAGSRERAEAFIKSLLHELELKMREVRTERFGGMESELAESASLAQLSYDKAANELQKMEHSLGTDLSALRALNDETPTDGTLQRTLQEYDNLKQATQLEIDKTVKLAELLEKAIDDPAQLVSSSALLELQPRLLRLLDRLDQALVDLSIKVGRSTELHPEVQNGRLAIIDIRKQTQREIQSSLRALDARIDQLKQRRSTLTADINKVKGRLERLSGIRVKYDKLHRDVEKKREILGQAQESLAEIYALRTSASRVNAFSRIGEPQVSTRPDGPGNRVIVMAGAFGGLVMGIGLLLLLAPGYDPNAGPEETPLSIQDRLKQTRQTLASHGVGSRKKSAEPDQPEVTGVVNDSESTLTASAEDPVLGAARPWPTNPSPRPIPAEPNAGADNLVVKPASKAEIALKPLVSKKTPATPEDLVDQATDSLIDASSKDRKSFVSFPAEETQAKKSPTSPASNESDLREAVTAPSVPTQTSGVSNIEPNQNSIRTQGNVRPGKTPSPVTQESKPKLPNTVPKISENVAARIQQVFGATEPKPEEAGQSLETQNPPADHSTVTITKKTTTRPQKDETPAPVDAKPIDPVRTSHPAIVESPVLVQSVASIDPKRVSPQASETQPQEPHGQSAHIRINVNPKPVAGEKDGSSEGQAPVDPVRRKPTASDSMTGTKSDGQETKKRTSDPTIALEQPAEKLTKSDAGPAKSIFGPKSVEQEKQPAAPKSEDDLTPRASSDVSKVPNPFMKPRGDEAEQDRGGFEGIPKTEASLGTERSIFRRPLDSIRTPVESDFDEGAEVTSANANSDHPNKKSLRPADIVKAASDQLDTQFSTREKTTSIPLHDSQSGDANQIPGAKKRPRIETGRDNPNPSPSQAEKVQEILSRLIGDEAEQDEEEASPSENKQAETAPKAANATMPIPDQIKKLGESLSSMFSPLDGDDPSN